MSVVVGGVRVERRRISAHEAARALQGPARLGRAVSQMVAEQLCVSMNVAVETLARAGIIESSGGTVRFLSRDETPAGWIPPAGSEAHV